MSDRIEEILQRSKKEGTGDGPWGNQEIPQKFCEKIENQIGPHAWNGIQNPCPLGHPVEEILNAADQEGCDAIVLGTHEKDSWDTLFLECGWFSIATEPKTGLRYSLPLRRPILIGTKSDRFIYSIKKAGSEWPCFFDLRPPYACFSSVSSVVCSHVLDIQTAFPYIQLTQSEFLSFHREKINGQEIKEERQSGQKNTADKEHFPRMTWV